MTWQPPSPPPAPPPWVAPGPAGPPSAFAAHTLDVRRPADRTVLAAAIVAGVACDVGVRSGIAGVGGALAVAVVAGAVLATRRLEQVQARVLVAVTPLFGVWLALTSSPSVLLLDIAAIAVLLLAGSGLARTGDVFDLRPGDVMARTLTGLGHWFVVPAFLAGARRQRARRPEGHESGRAAAVLRGAALAAPLVLGLGLLLGSADAVFASVFRVDVDLHDLPAHVALVGVGVWGMGWLLRLASADPPEAAGPLGRRLGAVEATVVLSSLCALFGGFTVAQVVAASEGGRRVLRTSGLTYAQYARSGFFQLLAVAAITLVVLLLLRALLDRPGGDPMPRHLVVLGEVAVVLTLLIVGVAVRRLRLYEDAYGFTLLRLFAQAAALWIGALFVVVAVAFAGFARRRAWVVGATSVLSLVTLLGLNLLNPDAYVARRSLDHRTAGGRLDPEYLGRLSDDGLAVVLRRLPELSADDRAAVVAALPCHRVGRDAPTGWLGWNRAAREEAPLLAEACAARPATASPSG